MYHFKFKIAFFLLLLIGGSLNVNAQKLKFLVPDEAIVQYGFLQIITVCLLGNVVEEVFYRGILFEMLKGEGNSMIGNIIAVILTSFIFAFMHVSLVDFSVTDMVANIPILMLGLTLTTLRCKTDNILCSVIVHIGINVIATI